MNAPMKKNAEAEATPVAAPSPVTAVPPAATIEAVVPPKKKGTLRRNLLMFGLPLVLAAGGAYFYLNGGRFVDTDKS